MSELAISVTDLVKKFSSTPPVMAVNGLDLAVKKGEIFGFLGPNGAGKTTSINIFSGLIQPTSGSVHVGGFDIKKHAHHIKSLIGVCPQEPATFGFMSGRQNIEFFGNLHCVPKSELKARTQQLLDHLGLAEDGDRLVKHYSGGMVRRINVAIALINQPDIVFLDEPTVGMDPQSRRAVWDFIRALKEKGTTVILTTHYIEEAEQLSERVGIIDKGKLIELGIPSELMEKYSVKSLEDVFLHLTGRRIREEM